MNAKHYRKQKLATRHFDRPLRACHLAPALAWQDKFTLLCQIRAEIAPKVAPELLPEIVSPVVRFASRRKNEAREVIGESRFALCAPLGHAVAAYDPDELAGGQEREFTPVLPVEPLEKVSE